MTFKFTSRKKDIDQYFELINKYESKGRWMECYIRDKL